MSHYDYRLESRQRAFELLVRWEGGCNATTLGDLFSLDRTNAGKDIRDYQSRFGGVFYDRSRRIFCPEPGFGCRLSDGSVNGYIELCAEHGRHTSLFDTASASPIPVREDVFQAVLQAMLAREPLDVTYQSWNHPAGIERRIHPHAIAYSGLRWHARAFDKRTQSYRDFNLNRMIAMDPVRGVDYVTGEADQAWHTRVPVDLIPNPALTSDEQTMIAAEFGMLNGVLRLNPRQSMCHYVLQSLNAVLADDERARLGRPYPVVVANSEDVQGLLFGASEQEPPAQ